MEETKQPTAKTGQPEIKDKPLDPKALDDKYLIKTKELSSMYEKGFKNEAEVEEYLEGLRNLGREKSRSYLAEEERKSAEEAKGENRIHRDMIISALAAGGSLAIYGVGAYIVGMDKMNQLPMGAHIIQYMAASAGVSFAMATAPVARIQNFFTNRKNKKA